MSRRALVPFFGLLVSLLAFESSGFAMTQRALSNLTGSSSSVSSRSSRPADTAVLLRSSSSSSSSSVSPATAYVRCMRSLAEEREGFIQLSLTGYYGYVQKALVQREKQILAAWNIEDQNKRRDALSAAWRDFGNTWRAANNQLKDLRTKAWKKFRIALANCSASAQDEENGGWGRDSQF